MASQNGQDNVPDSWDDNTNGSNDTTAEVTSQLSGLNVNAAVFNPGQNVFAQSFVPGGQYQAPPPNTTQQFQTPETVQSQQITSSTDGEIQSQGD